MKAKYIVRLLALPLMLFATVVVAQPQKPAMKFTDLSKPLPVSSKKSTVTVTLQANPTTGFSWFLKSYNSKLVTPISYKYYPPAKAMPGAPGYVVWKFHLKSGAFVVPRITKIAFVYMRPWTNEGKQKKVLTLVLHK